MDKHHTYGLNTLLQFKPDLTTTMFFYDFQSTEQQGVLYVNSLTLYSNHSLTANIVSIFNFQTTGHRGTAVVDCMSKGHWLRSLRYLFRYHYFGICRAFYRWSEIFINFCPAIEAIMWLTDAQKSSYRKPKFWKFPVKNDIAKSHSYVPYCRTWNFSSMMHTKVWLLSLQSASS
mgnify:CR=1 FL=1